MRGGAHGHGAVTRIGLDGAFPSRLLQAADGHFYGTTGHFAGPATVFRVRP